MNRTYRKGAIGALTDEYEKALNEMNYRHKRSGNSINQKNG